MEEDFYATIKFNSGEEIFSRVCPCVEEDRTLLVMSLPVTIEEVTVRNNVYGYKLEPWLKTSTEDMLVVDLKNVLTMTENNDIQIITIYEKFLNEVSGKKTSKVKPSREMGYVSSVTEAKKLLEKLYNQKSS